MASLKSAKESGTMVFIVVVLLLTLVGAGTGIAVGSIVHGNPGQDKVSPELQKPDGEQTAKAGESAAAPDAHATQKEASTEEAVEDDTAVIDPASLKVFAVPPVLTTLSQPKGRWIRLEGSILTAADTQDPPELLAERAGEQILTYLRSLRLEQIEGPSNVLALREDLTEMLRVLSKDQVKGILINGLVVE